MVAFLQKSVAIKSAPASTPSTLPCTMTVSTDGDARAEADEGGGVSECIEEADLQEAGAREERV
jgi:hypothetical protein